MKMELRFGSKNIKGNKPQNIYIRIKHSNLDWDKSLGIVVHPDNWDFKKKEIITTKAFNNPIDTEQLKEVSQKLYEVSKFLQYKAEGFYHSNIMEVREWVKDKNRLLWIELCETWYKEYKDKNKLHIEPYFMKAYYDSMERLEPGWKKASTKVRWETIGRNLESYMKAKGKIRTNEFSKLLWARMVKYFQNEYVSERTQKVGLHDSTIKTILKKINAVYDDLEGIHNFHKDIPKFNLTVAPKEFDTLNENELNQLWNYEGGKDIAKTKRRIWVFKIQYYGCFRISEVILNLTKSQAKNSPLKTPLEIWNDVQMTTNANGENIFIWKVNKVKTKANQKITTKNVPIHRKLAECLFGYMPKDLNDTDKFPTHLMVDDLRIHNIESQNTLRTFMKAALKDLGINKRIATHEMRKSFITNYIGKNKSFGDVANFSGHVSEKAMHDYINQAYAIQTDIDLND